MNLLVLGLAIATVGVAGCSSPTAGSPAAVQNEVTSSESPLLTSSPAKCDPGMEYSCGAVGPGGGIIFYASAQAFALSNGYSAACSTNCHYLEAQTSDLPGKYQWCVGTGLNHAAAPVTGNYIGTGYSNTQTIANAGYCSSGAANAALASVFGGYTDWFLPSTYELQSLYVERAKVGGMSAVVYWSSTQSGSTNAFYENFISGFQDAENKGGMLAVRAVRAF